MILSNAGLVKIKTFVERYVEVYPSEDAWWSSSFDGDWKQVGGDMNEVESQLIQGCAHFST